jgi:hypothetical protein
MAALEISEDSPLGSRTNPVALLTGFELHPGAQVSIRPGSEYTIDGPVSISYSLGCSTITAGPSMKARETARIMPTAALTSAFSHGWHKLPYELKLKIITPTVLNRVDTDLFYIAQENVSNVFTNLVIPWAKISPEMGATAAQAFYEKNYFLVDGYTTYTKLPGTITIIRPKLPPPAVAKQIRNLIYKLSLDLHSFQRMARIACGEYGFKNLSAVYIEIQSRNHSLRLPNMTKAERRAFRDEIRFSGPTDGLEVLTNGEKVAFKTKGYVCVDGDASPSPQPWLNNVAAGNGDISEVWRCEWIQDQVYLLLKSSIVFEKE